ncbi:MAG: Xaa-Pro peptidase family protein [Spirochaetaceae bacterium]|nr:Xaa-Pro peptidase family protein [Spirochaetaceae bacterium]
MKNVFAERQEKIFKQLSSSNIFATVLKDFEGSRNSSIRYLTGHPQDAILFIFAKGATLLVPWDINLAKEKSCCTEIIPYTEFNRIFSNAVVSIFSGKVPPQFLKYLKSSLPKQQKEKIEFPGSSSWLEIKELKKLMPNKTILCRKNGIDSMLGKNRVIKDEKEISIYREAAKITDKIIDELEQYIKKSINTREITEVEIALLIEKLIRENGAEGTGFETLVAGPKRSWAIHPYPAFSSSPVTNTGTTIIDFGIKYEGYITDVTITLAGKNLTDKQKEIIDLVTKAANRTEKLLKPGISAIAVSENIRDFFAQYGYSMPHSLGHGIGLDVHENPVFKISSENKQILKQGMVVAIEPGLYDPLAGGVRLENDYLITKNGCEKITNAQIIYLLN